MHDASIEMSTFMCVCTRARLSSVCVNKQCNIPSCCFLATVYDHFGTDSIVYILLYPMSRCDVQIKLSFPIVMLINAAY
jgi:hypothetical protein